MSGDAGPVHDLHDLAILDALEAIGAETFASQVWRVTRKGRDPLRPGAAGGRWSLPGGFEVLYTSLEKAGALAEVGFRLSLEPVWPSRLQHEIHALSARLGRALRLADLGKLQTLGVDTARYAGFDYAATRAIAAAAHFLEFDGLIVPSARHTCLNAVIFPDRLNGNAGIEVETTEAVGWGAWRGR